MQTKIKTSKDKGDSESGLVIERRFTSAGQDPFESFEWIDMDVEIRNPDGSIADSRKSLCAEIFAQGRCSQVSSERS